MADNVQLDGIKKMSEEEKQHSRDIVLDLIGEKEEKKETAENETYKITNKKLDGVLAVPSEPKIKSPLISEVKKQEWKKEINKIAPKETKPEPRSVIKPEIKEIKKEVVKKDIAKKIDVAPILKNKQKIKSSFFESFLGIKKEESIVYRKPIVTNPVIKKEIKPLPKKNIFAFDERTIVNWKRMEQTINSATRSALFYFFIFFVLMLVLYLTLTLSIIKFKLDNPWLRDVADKIIIPAIITKDGVIDYYQFKDFKAEYNLPSLTAKNEIIKNLIASKLFEKLKLADDLSPVAIAKAMSSNEDVNRAPLERIRSIKQLVAGGNDFASTTAKYGDETGRIVIAEDNGNNYSFYPEIRGMNKDKISDVVYAPEGYYIFKCIDKNENNQSFDYVLIKTKSLDNYLQEMMRNYRYISLVN